MTDTSRVTFSAFYRNWRGEVRWRILIPISIWFGSTEFHQQNQWFLQAEAEDGCIKDFALTYFLGETQPIDPKELEPLGASLTVGNGLVVYGTIEALGRVQNHILMSSRHPIEASDTKRQLARALASTEAQLMAANDKIEELTKLLMQSKTA